MATPSTFMDRLAPETRVHIYGHIFGPSKHIRRPASYDGIEDGTIDRRIRHMYFPTRKPTGIVPIPTTIILVSKKVYAEALETLFDSKTVRLRLEQFCIDIGKDYQTFLRRLEFTDCLTTSKGKTIDKVKGLASVRPFFPLLIDAITACSKLSRLGRLSSYSLLSDCLAYSAERQGSISVREFVDTHKLGDLTCVDVGQYRLVTGFGAITIKNSKLLKMWPNVRSAPANFDLRAEVKKITEERIDWISLLLPREEDFPANLMLVWSAHASLRLWVALLERALLPGSSPDVSSPEFAFTREVEWWASTVKHVGSMDTLGGTGVLFHQLGLQHSSAVLEWATELLVTNLETYDAGVLSGRLETIDCVACWPELEGGESPVAEGAKLIAERSTLA